MSCFQNSLAESHWLLPCFRALARTSKAKITVISCLRKLSHTVWHCQYHIYDANQPDYGAPQSCIEANGVYEVCGNYVEGLEEDAEKIYREDLPLLRPGLHHAPQKRKPDTV